MALDDEDIFIAETIEDYLFILKLIYYPQDY